MGMILGIATIIGKLFNMGIGNPDALKWARRVVLALVIIAVIVPVALVWRACKPKVWLNEAEIQKGEKAVKEANDAALKQVLIESDVRAKEISDNSQDATAKTVEAINEAKTKFEGMSRDELQAEFDRRAGK